MEKRVIFTTEINKLEREGLLTLRNPKYNEMINKYNQLQGIQIHDTDTKNLLPNRIILAASGFENTRG